MRIRKRRVFVVVLDSFGVGFEPDAEEYGDVGANTLESIQRTEYLDIPVLTAMGLGNIEGVDCLTKDWRIPTTIARLRELSSGKDTTVGHFELMGLKSSKPFPTYKNGFPKEIIEEFERQIGRKVLCNKPYSGTEVIKDYGNEHMDTGYPIVYTSADSVFQIAAHEDIISVPELYDMCEKARNILVGEHGVARVIARPFTGHDSDYRRTNRRRDFSITPPRDTALNKIQNAGMDVIAIGKITDIFAGSGITRSLYTHSNVEGISKTMEMARENFNGICFTNLVDFDMLYGHRQDAVGYATAMSQFDRHLVDLMKIMTPGDTLIITADHGCDPSDDSTDHTREYVPMIVYGMDNELRNLGTLEGFGAVGQLCCDLLGVDFKAEAAEKIIDTL